MIRAHVEEMEGERDALRFGRVRVHPGNRCAAFRYDRLSGMVTFNPRDQQDRGRTRRFDDLKPAEIAAATAAVHAHLPPLGAAA